MSIDPDQIDYDKSEGRALRLLELYFYIEEHPGVKSDDLVQKFGISPASLYRDIQSLRRMGIGIDYTSPNRGGYQIEKGSIRFMRVKPDELKPLLIAKQLLQKLTFPDGEIFNRLMTQIVGTVREGELKRAQHKVEQYLYFRAPSNRRFTIECQQQVKHLSELLEAAENQWSVSLQYSRSTEKGARTVNPLGLWFGHNAWYLAAWDQRSKSYRTFAVDRIEEVTVLKNKPFTPPVGFNLAEWVETAWIAMPSEPGDVETVELAFEYQTGCDIAQSYWHRSQNFIIPHDKDMPVLASFELSKSSLSTEFLAWVRSFGSKVNVISPDWLAKLQ